MGSTPTIFFARSFITMDDATPSATAVAVQDGDIIAVGGRDDGDLRRLNGSRVVGSGSELREERNCLMSDRPDRNRKQHGAKTD